MADNAGDEIIPRGNEWEVVSLTASAYAAAPGPKEVETKDDNEGDSFQVEGAETSHALFMSGHFVFPPSEHGNLPLEPDSDSSDEQHISQDDVASELGVEEDGRSRTKDEDEPLKVLNIHDEFQKHDTKFEEEATLSGLDLSNKDEGLYSSATFSSLHCDEALGGTAIFCEDTTVSELIEDSEQGLDFPADIPHSPKALHDDEYDVADLPCEAWWKRRAVSLYSHAKGANAFWSIFIATAVMGVVILGQRWQQERWQALQLKWQHSINNEKTGRVLSSISRLKDVIAGGHRRGPYEVGSFRSEI